MNSPKVANKISLYVIEDSGELSEMIGEFFSQFFEVTVFNDAMEALLQATISPPDIVLTDLRQAERSRKQLIKKMLQLKHQIDVYMVSSDSANIRFQHRASSQVRKVATIDLPGVLSEILERTTLLHKSA